MQIKRELPWLGELPSNTVRYTMKHLSEAYKRFFGGAGRPVWQRKFKNTPSFTVPANIKIKGKKIYIPKLGWGKLTGKNPYADCKPKQAAFKYETEKIDPKYTSQLWGSTQSQPEIPICLSLWCM